MTDQWFDRLVDRLSHLPGIGRKTATRLAFTLVDDRELARELSDALRETWERVRECPRCRNLTEGDMCAVCADDSRAGTVCVVENPADLRSIEDAGLFMVVLVFPRCPSCGSSLWRRGERPGSPGKPTPTEVERETARLLESMTSAGGGYILAASHTVPPETPPENVFAMYAAAGLGREEIMDAAAAIRARRRATGRPER